MHVWWQIVYINTSRRIMQVSLNLIKMERVVYLGDYALPVIEIHPNSKSIEGRDIKVFTYWMVP